MIETTLAGPSRFSLSFTPEAPAIRVARETVRAALAAWDLADLADDAELVTSELVTNALRYAADATVVLTHEPGRVLLEVVDDNPEPPHAEAAGPVDEHGRGLLIVAALAADWGWRPDGTGKSVWALLTSG
ncbi:ATP-binding protein [Actinomadura flavalba]|uniref:ATP-binding protein n=1 Tax=Actinomadura flavalba TaxID=1120938 RepID=UPI000365394F|nr:ATP-binding protein [Actinomadura flavalba]